MALQETKTSLCLMLIPKYVLRDRIVSMVFRNPAKKDTMELQPSYPWKHAQDLAQKAITVKRALLLRLNMNVVTSICIVQLAQLSPPRSLRDTILVLSLSLKLQDMCKYYAKEVIIA